MKHLIAMILLLFMSISAFADPIDNLKLTDAEMQKLKKYFPVDDETDHLIWKGDPITIKLPMGKEKRIIFPTRISADIKNALTTDQLRLLNNDKSLYFTAIQSFPLTRIFVSLKDTGEVLLIDLATDDHASNSSQYIDIKKNNEVINNSSITIPTKQDNANETNVTYVDLIRFAWQEAYAPERLVKNITQYPRAPMHTNKFVPDLVYGDKVIAFPQSSWVSGSYYVTAVLLRNKYSHTTHIDIRKELCGDWQAATLYPRSTLKPYGDKEKDSTMLFIVSLHPFGDTLGVCHGNAQNK